MVATTTRLGFVVPPEMIEDEKEHRRQIAKVVQGAMQGKLNATLTVTLSTSSTTTTVTDLRLGAGSHLSLMPTTASARDAQKSGIWWDNAKSGSIRANHLSTTLADMTFTALLIG